MANWDQIREDYEGIEKTLAEISIEHNVSRSSLYYRARTRGWQMRGQGVNKRRRLAFDPKDGCVPTMKPGKNKALIERLYFAFEQQIADFENQIRIHENPDVKEKDARTLGSLARTLEKLIELKGDATEEDNTLEKEVDLERLREELARRIELVRQKR